MDPPRRSISSPFGPKRNSLSKAPSPAHQASALASPSASISNRNQRQQARASRQVSRALSQAPSPTPSNSHLPMCTPYNAENVPDVLPPDNSHENDISDLLRDIRDMASQPVPGNDTTMHDPSALEVGGNLTVLPQGDTIEIDPDSEDEHDANTGLYTDEEEMPLPPPHLPNRSGNFPPFLPHPNAPHPLPPTQFQP